jgi:hypothetical protein
MANDH